MYKVIKEKYRKDESIKDLMMSPRTTIFLLKNNIYELEVLKQFSEKDLKNIKGMSTRSFTEIKNKLKEFGLSLRE